MSFCTSLPNFIQIHGRKMTSCRFSRWRRSAILNFMGTIMGSLKTPCRTSYRSSVKTIALNCLVFEKIACLCTHFGDRQTDEQMDRPNACAIASGGWIIMPEPLAWNSTAVFCGPLISIIRANIQNAFCNFVARLHAPLTCRPTTWRRKKLAWWKPSISVS